MSNEPNQYKAPNYSKLDKLFKSYKEAVEERRILNAKLRAKFEKEKQELLQSQLARLKTQS